MKFPGIITAHRDLLDTETCIDGRYVPARPLPFYGRFWRFKAAWLVFTGRADALVWPGQ